MTEDQTTAHDPGPAQPQRRQGRARRFALRVVLFTTIWLIVILILGYWRIIYMPGTSYSGTLPDLSANQARVAEQLRADVQILAGDIGPRHTGAPADMARAVDHIAQALTAAGWPPEHHSFNADGVACTNVIAQRPGTTHPSEIVVIGAHYDTVPGCPGANDNTTGTAALLELARIFAPLKFGRTLRFCAFANEEPPHFQTDTMGSLVYAKMCAQRGDRIVAMLSLETLGSYSDDPGSQAYPFPFDLFYPSKGNFVAFVGNMASRDLVQQTLSTFRDNAQFPSEGVSAPAAIPGIGWSDQWSFWEVGYPALMITDTAPFRYAHYHDASDTVDKVDFARLARVVDGLVPVIAELANVSP